MLSSKGNRICLPPSTTQIRASNLTFSKQLQEKDKMKFSKLSPQVKTLLQEPTILTNGNWNLVNFGLTQWLRNECLDSLRAKLIAKSTPRHTYQKIVWNHCIPIIRCALSFTSHLTSVNLKGIDSNRPLQDVRPTFNNKNSKWMDRETEFLLWVDPWLQVLKGS